MGSSENRLSVQCVALRETGIGTNNHGVEEVKGIPVEVIDPSFSLKGSFAISERGLERITEAGLVYDNPVEPRHVQNITLVSADWEAITRVTGIPQEDILRAFEDSKRPSVRTGDSVSYRCSAEHAAMMDRENGFA